VVGRRGLEPRTSALIDLERSTTEGRTLHETAGVIRPGFGVATFVIVHGAFGGLGVAAGSQASGRRR
jgi:hypothetical protein